MVTHSGRNQNQSSATVITTDSAVTDDKNTPVSTQSTDTNLKSTFTKQLEDQNLFIKRLKKKVKTFEPEGLLS